MKALVEVDFLERRRVPVPGVLALVLALGGLAWAAQSTLEESSQLDRDRAGLAGLFKSRQGPVAPMSADDRKRHAQLDALSSYMAAPWSELLDVFERHGGDGTALARLEHDAASGQLKVTARSKDTMTMMRYVIGLEQDKALAGVELRGHEMQRSDPVTPLQFELTARWRTAPAAAEPAASASTPREVASPAAPGSAASASARSPAAQASVPSNAPASATSKR